MQDEGLDRDRVGTPFHAGFKEGNSANEEEGGVLTGCKEKSETLERNPQ